MLKIALVEDQQTELETLVSFLERYRQEQYLPFKLVTFTNPLGLLENYAGDYQIIFLDIRMPFMDGMEAAHRIRELDPNVIIIFVTSLAQYAVEGYEVNALDFIVKPVKYYDFAMKLQRAIARIHMDDKLPKITVSTKKGKMKLLLQEILYVEARNHHVYYHTSKGEFVEYNTMKEIEAKLSPCGFARCNNCYLVHLKYVTKIRGYSVYVGEEELQISQPRKKEFVQAVVEYTEGK